MCTRELCVFAFQTLGVMSDAAEAIATDGDVSTCTRVYYMHFLYTDVCQSEGPGFDPQLGPDFSGLTMTQVM